MIKNKRTTAIILAAGCGSRMNMSTTKQRLEICGESILRHTVRAFEQASTVDSIVVVCRQEEISWAEGELLNEFKKVNRIVSGGKVRAESAIKGFEVVNADTGFVAIHDGARCLVTSRIIDEVVLSAYEFGAATAATPVTDSVKLADENGFIDKSVSRERLYSAQTPQVFSYELYNKAVTNKNAEEAFTDDNMLVEAIGGRISLIDTGRQNIKITTQEDIEYAEYILERRGSMGELRIGHGYDVHRLVEGRKLILGGVEIPHIMGLLGHSDADVLTHAVMDAILGACALGDIGKHFPDADEKYKGISSMVLLAHVAELIASKGFVIENIDATLILQKPKIALYIDGMIDNFANILEINRGRINIKATTEEHLGFTGREEGVSAHAVVLIKKRGE